MKTAVVCGAGGFIGSHLVKRLKSEGYWVRGVDVKKPEFSPTAADEFQVLDLREEANCRAAVALGSGVVDEVYQLAAYTGKTGETIRVRASDDFGVVGVGVAIRDTDSKVLEQGAATASSDGAWTYTTTTNLPAGQQVVIEVSATDRPGHKTTKKQPKG